jgi:hypothetical protein
LKHGKYTIYDPKGKIVYQALMENNKKKKILVQPEKKKDKVGYLDIN